MYVMLLSHVNQVAIVEWLNKQFKKKNGSTFTAQDVQGYVRRGKLPKYLGGNRIVKIGDNCKTFNIK